MNWYAPFVCSIVQLVSILALHLRYIFLYCIWSSESHWRITDCWNAPGSASKTEWRAAKRVIHNLTTHFFLSSALYFIIKIFVVNCFVFHRVRYRQPNLAESGRQKSWMAQFIDRFSNVFRISVSKENFVALCKTWVSRPIGFTMNFTFRFHFRSEKRKKRNSKTILSKCWRILKWN